MRYIKLATLQEILETLPENVRADAQQRWISGRVVYIDDDGDYCIGYPDESERQSIGIALGRSIADRRDPNGGQHVLVQLNVRRI